MVKEKRRKVRNLYSWEITEARYVFADQLDYYSVRIHEYSKWPNYIDRFSNFLRRAERSNTHNAITLGNHCFFPIELPRNPTSISDSEYYKICWLIHELTHVWQYQKLGWKYLYMALRDQIRLGRKAYDFGGEKGLHAYHKKGVKLKELNLEQQGDLTRTYYERICTGEDVTAWSPYISEIQKTS